VRNWVGSGRVSLPTKLERCVVAKKKRVVIKEKCLFHHFFSRNGFFFGQWNRQLPLMTPRLLLLLISVRRKGRGREGSVCGRQWGGDRIQYNTIKHNTTQHNTTQNVPTHWMSQSYYIPVESELYIYIYIYGRRSCRTCRKLQQVDCSTNWDLPLVSWMYRTIHHYPSLSITRTLLQYSISVGDVCRFRWHKKLWVSVVRGWQHHIAVGCVGVVFVLFCLVLSICTCCHRTIARMRRICRQDNQ